MSNELQKVDKDLSVIDQYTSEQMNLIKKQIANGCNDNELVYFLNVCKSMNLDPFQNQIYAVKFGNKLSIQTGIGGLRAIAGRTGELGGESCVEFYDPQAKEWTEVWDREGKPLAGRVSVYRKGCEHPFTAVLHWKEFHSGKNLQKDKPLHMFAKTVRAAALRMAFPTEIGGLHVQGEVPEDNSEPSQIQQELSQPLVSQSAPSENEDAEIVEEETFDLSRHKELLTGIIQQFGCEPAEIADNEKKNLVAALKGVSIDDVPNIVKAFVEGLRS